MDLSELDVKILNQCLPYNYNQIHSENWDYVVGYDWSLSYDGVHHVHLIKDLNMKKEYVLVNALQLPAEVINQMEEAILLQWYEEA